MTKGAILRSMRKSVGLNQTEFGRLIGYGQQHMSHMESGKIDVPPGVLLAAEALLARHRNGIPLDADVLGC